MRNPVFVVGAARSGTTLLSVLLDRHSQLAMTPETGFYRELVPWLRLAPVVGVEFLLRRWRRLPELGLTPGQISALCGRNPPAGALLNTLLDLYAEARRKPRAGEKTPLHLRYVPRILQDFPEARILCIYRDGRDAALSLHAMPWGPKRLETAAEAWLKAIQLMQESTAAHPAHFRAVRYEALLADPREHLGEAMRFIGLDLEESQLDASPSGVVLERSKEWKGKALEPVDPKLAGYRQAAAQAGDLQRLERMLGPTLREFGYEAAR
ncbi:MAG: sulfotransferase [Bryobacterales bacterium]|nr:sulfotransferase [Bryobacterales bacterium]